MLFCKTFWFANYCDRVTIQRFSHCKPYEECRQIQGISIEPGSTVTSGREPKSCLGRVFNSKLGCIAALLSKCLARMPQPLLELKTRPRARPVSLSLSMIEPIKSTNSGSTWVNSQLLGFGLNGSQWSIQSRAGHGRAGQVFVFINAGSVLS